MISSKNGKCEVVITSASQKMCFARTQILYGDCPFLVTHIYVKVNFLILAKHLNTEDFQLLQVCFRDKNLLDCTA